MHLKYNEPVALGFLHAVGIEKILLYDEKIEFATAK